MECLFYSLIGKLALVIELYSQIFTETQYSAISSYSIFKITLYYDEDCMVINENTQTEKADVLIDLLWQLRKVKPL